MPKLHPILTPASARVLRWMIDEGEELVCEGIEAWVGQHRTHPRIADRLLEWCLLRDVTDDGGKLRRYAAHDECRLVLADPNYETRWQEHLRTGKPVTR